MQLVGRGHAGIDRHLVNHLGQFFGGQRVEHLSGLNAAVIADPQIISDETGRQGMVAGDHDGADAGGLGRGHGRFHFRPWRIDHAHQANDRQLALQLILRRIDPLHADTQHAHTVLGHLLVGLVNPLAPAVIQRLRFAPNPDKAADLQ